MPSWFQNFKHNWIDGGGEHKEAAANAQCVAGGLNLENNDARTKPNGQVADLIHYAVNPPVGQPVPLDLVLGKIVPLLINDTATLSIEAVWAIHYHLHSADQVRVRNTLVTLDLIYQNSGFPFANLLMCLEIVAAWQTVEVNRTYQKYVTLDYHQEDPVDKIARIFDNLMKAEYPFPIQSLKNISPERIQKLRNTQANVGTTRDRFKALVGGTDIHFKTYKAGCHIVV
ncbi:hypothetical protein HDU79_006597 [Rhizoclosmatium sp. JEL0117]|nr:hypothetical protein HDU79_006597 [Rhizoclosmatium sp. JEL0117]